MQRVELADRVNLQIHDIELAIRRYRHAPPNGRDVAHRLAELGQRAASLATVAARELPDVAR